MSKTPEPSPLTPAQVTDLRLKYLTDETSTIKSLAQELGLPVYRVSSLLKGKDFDAFKESIQKTVVSLAKDKLHSHAEKAAELWGKAMPVAASKGDHRPMKDLLTAIHAIDSEAKQPLVTVQIGLSVGDVTLLPGVSAGNPVDGQVLGPADSTGHSIPAKALPPATD